MKIISTLAAIPLFLGLASLSPSAHAASSVTQPATAFISALRSPDARVNLLSKAELHLAAPRHRIRRRHRRRYIRRHYYVPYYRGYYYGYGPRYGRCDYWRKRCIANWGYGNPDFYGCMRYHGCR